MKGLEYLVCIFCGKNSHLSRLRPEAFDSFSGDWDILQVREALPGPGRGRREKGKGGFVIDRDRSLTISEMLESQGHRELALSVKGKLLRIVAEYLRLGVITMEELEACAGAAHSPAEETRGEPTRVS